jgi:hypothetical protein
MSLKIISSTAWRSCDANLLGLDIVANKYHERWVAIHCNLWVSLSSMLVSPKSQSEGHILCSKMNPFLEDLHEWFCTATLHCHILWICAAPKIPNKASKLVTGCSQSVWSSGGDGGGSLPFFRSCNATGPSSFFFCSIAAVSSEDFHLVRHSWFIIEDMGAFPGPSVWCPSDATKEYRINNCQEEV